jgi:signal transduction histidine kinase
VLNPAGRRLLELGVEPQGMPYHEALKDVPPLAAVISEFLATGEPIVRRTVNLPGTMKATHFGVTVSPLATGSVKAGAICLFADLTNVVELEEQLRLKETLARLGELTAGIAHEFRNGLATIHGYSRLLDPAVLPVQCRPYVEGIRQEAEVLGKVVTNFLDFARPQQVAFGRVDLGQIARRAVDDIKHELPAGTDVTVAGEFGHVDGDDVLLRQVFGNLLRNAAEACDQHGVRPAIVIEGKLDPLHRSCRVVVDDNGPGIPVSEREKVFRPFVTTRSRGTGLGLAIVQKIVLTHRGRVSIGSSPAGGASVQITIQTP